MNFKIFRELYVLQKQLIAFGYGGACTMRPPSGAPINRVLHSLYVCMYKKKICFERDNYVIRACTVLKFNIYFLIVKFLVPNLSLQIAAYQYFIWSACTVGIRLYARVYPPAVQHNTAIGTKRNLARNLRFFFIGMNI